MKQTSTGLLVASFLLMSCESFQPTPSHIALFSNTPQLYRASTIRNVPTTHRGGKSSPTLSAAFGDVFSGVTGVPPSELEPPVDLLAGTSLDPANDRVDLVRVYKGSKDGWSAVNFHECVDGRGSGVVVALTKSGRRFGGFNPNGWMSTDDYSSSNAAFLWFKEGETNTRVPILAGGNTAAYDYATGGPCFGAADLLIGPPKAAVMGGFAGPDMENTAVNSGNLKEGKSSLGGAYDFVKGWPCRGAFGLAEVEVYCNGNIQIAGSVAPGWWPF